MKAEEDMVLFKIIILGNSNVGKTNFIMRYTDNLYSDNTMSTYGHDFKNKWLIKHGEKKIKLQIWDTAGQERFKTFIKSMIQGVHGVIIMFDLCEKTSFVDAFEWITQVIELTRVPIVIVGNKCDMNASRVIVKEEAEKMGSDLSFEYFEASAKDNINVEKVFEKLTDLMLSDRKIIGDHHNTIIEKRLHTKAACEKKKKCC